METDIVDVDMFLKGCTVPLEQYRECLMKNLKDWSGRGLHRAKLSNVKIHQLSQMNITRFDHQKMITARIRELPNIPSMRKYHLGRMDICDELEAAVPVELDSQQRGTLTCTSSAQGGGGNYGGQSQEESLNADRRPSRNRDRGDRRRSTQGGDKGTRERWRRSLAGERNWEAINKARTETNGSTKQKKLDDIRRRKSQVGAQVADVFNSPEPGEIERHASGGTAKPLRGANNDSGSVGSLGTNSTETRARRDSHGISSFDPTKQAKIREAQTKRQRAIEYGNSALKATSREVALKDLRKQILADFMDTLDCERATLMLIDTPAQEIFFFDGPIRISFPLKAGIAGHCASTGMSMVVNDPYSHPFFNPEIDRATDFQTRNILCEPIKSRRGGNVVAVLEMLNKKDGQNFTEQDSAVMEMCAVKVANALDTTFAALISAEQEWSQVAGRRPSLGDAKPLNTAKAAAAAAPEQPAPPPPSASPMRTLFQADLEAGRGGEGSLVRRQSSTLSLAEDKGACELRDSFSGPEISNRRGSGTSAADAKKLKRRSSYGKEVRDNAIGLW